ncbi:MAG: hypothetical protein LBG44_03480 [Gemmatimonadota bacterium]|jgi:hypothetical protein|nr:hypothetical protein [Gemmatimonadota bacterium]
MNLTRRLEAGLWVSALVVGLWTAVTWKSRSLLIRQAEGVPVQPLPDFRPADPGALMDLSRSVVDRNPFRLSHLPPEEAPVLYDPGVYTDYSYMEPFRMLPPLRVVGFVGGPPWQALVAGIPGREQGVVARAGDVFDDFLIRRVGPDTVVITGMDTIWHLTLEPAW